MFTFASNFVVDQEYLPFYNLEVLIKLFRIYLSCLLTTDQMNLSPPLFFLHPSQPFLFLLFDLLISLKLLPNY